MPRIRYCRVQLCENFTGTTNREIRMFKFPDEKEQNKRWIDAINEYNDDHHKSNGSGLICEAHFLDSDMQKKSNGQVALKYRAIPVYFNNLVQLIEENDQITSSPTEKNLQIEINELTKENSQIKSSPIGKVVQIEFNQLKQAAFETKTELELEIQKKDNKIEKLMNTCDEQFSTIANLRRKIADLEATVKEKTSEIKSLHEQKKHESFFPETYDIHKKEVIDCLVNGQSLLKKYPQSVREFSLVLYYSNPRAYEYVRRTFDGHLPHNSTLRRWYANSDLNVEPGITEKAIEFLRKKVADKKNAGEELVCSVCFDEMSIRKQITWSQKDGHMLGYATYGNTNDEEPAVAKEAIVFVANGLNERFSIPVAYHFLNSLDAPQKLQLVTKVLVTLLNVGVIVTSITFDGHSTNKKICKLLGANLNVYDVDFKPYFMLNGFQIFLFLDICHMEKLVRGQLDKKSPLTNGNGGLIDWKYIAQLVKFKYEKGFSATHKLSRSHIEWRSRPMNVRLAVETFSKSTADSLEHLMAKNYDEFAGATETIEFIRLHDDLFDVQNTKDVHNKENSFKNALSNANKNEVFALFARSIEYIKNLQFTSDGKRKFICKSIAKTGFIGFILNMRSLQMMYEKYVEEEQILKSIPTYYLNQDAVEMFFGKIRAMGGCDDNPDVIRFHAAYRKLLGIDSILQSTKGNCQAFQINSDPFSDILFVSSRRDKCMRNDNEEEMVVLEEYEILHEKLVQLNITAQNDLTDDLKHLTIAHIANSIEDKIKTVDSCIHCVHVFNSSKKVESAFFSSSFAQRPCLSTFRICKVADQFLKLEFLKGSLNINTIYYSILNNLDIDQMFNDVDFSMHSSHKLYLIRSIVDGYVQIKGLFMARTATQDLHAKKFRYRMKKLIHFSGQ